MFPGLQTLVFPRESKQGGGTWDTEALGKPPVVDSSLLPPSHCQQVPSAFRGEQLALHWGWSFLPMQESGTLVPDTEGSFGSAAQVLLSIYVTFSTWCELVFHCIMGACGGRAW